MINKKYLNIYLAGLENEYYVDKLVLNRYYPQALRYLTYIPPRSLHLMSYFKNYLSVFNLLLFFLDIFWWLIFYPIFIIIQLIQALYLKFRKFKIKPCSLENNKSIAIFFTPRHKKAILRGLAKNDIANLTWIGFKHCKNQDFLRIEEMMTLKNIIKVFFTTIILPIKAKKILAIKEKNNPGFKFQLFDVFQCYLYMNWLEGNRKNFKNVYICSLGDRWATITTEFSHSFRLHLIQHGILKGEIFKPPVKLKNVFALYIFNEESKKIYFNNILQEKPEKVHFFPATIQLKEKLSHSAFYKRCILLIGQPYCIEKEYTIIDYILNNYPSYFLYIKPHPLFSFRPYDRYRGRPNVKIIKKIDYYPKVDLAITSFSTLGLEYKICGQEVFFFYDIEIPEILNNIDNLLGIAIRKVW